MNEEHLFRSGGTLGQIEYDQLLMGVQRLDDFVQWFTFDFRADDVDLMGLVARCL